MFLQAEDQTTAKIAKLQVRLVKGTEALEQAVEDVRHAKALIQAAESKLERVEMKLQQAKDAKAEEDSKNGLMSTPACKFSALVAELEALKLSAEMTPQLRRVLDLAK